MNTKSRTEERLAFTLLELLLVFVMLVILAAFLLPAVAPRHRHHGSQRIYCVNNQKQVGLAFRVWAGDNNDNFPMAVSTNQGGAMETISTDGALAIFQTMSNELSTPKILICPSDDSRHSATNFTADFKRINISYFVGVDAIETNATMLLIGDRNITNETRLRSGLLELTTNNPAGWTSDIHQKMGNICLVDGNVQQVSTPGLRTAIENSGTSTNRLAIP